MCIFCVFLPVLVLFACFPKHECVFTYGTVPSPDASALCFCSQINKKKSSSMSLVFVVCFLLFSLHFFCFYIHCSLIPLNHFCLFFFLFCLGEGGSLWCSPAFIPPEHSTPSAHPNEFAKGT